eukprot:CAMPEP_0202728366 /NCGR_PEP_ID=MMETSP1385-20130828/185590_1 /ASSEMBLY_ACC=CAM_ASM_000861 /TAXON_ID=933848 /ORGANISM="Elphidium margaritaceum" /LENGTH=456 /DNA_ID=CAMNT_0049394613 /DNA_START=42 /DNA_END=1412 /DNA_ORIENTATION=+
MTRLFLVVTLGICWDCWPITCIALPPEFGVDVSTGFQSTPLSPASIGQVTSSSLLDGVKYYKFFGSQSDHDIATGILAASSSPSNIRFYIGIPESTGAGLDALEVSNIAALVAEWDDLKSNINYIALTNEPGNVNANFSALPIKLEMVYTYIRAQPGWEHVHVSIPFCCILGASWPVPQSYFKPEYASDITRVIEIYEEYGGVFSTNLYPYFVTESEPQLLPYILGTETGEYTSMLAAQYMATWYAMQAIVPSNTLEIVIAETGWSTQGSSSSWWSTLENAQLFWNSTLHQMSDANAELYGVKIYAFELFDENQKYGGDHEQHFGLYTMSGESKGVLPGSVAPTTPAPTTPAPTTPAPTTPAPTTGDHEQHFGLYTMSGESKGVLPAAADDMEMESTSTMYTTTEKAIATSEDDDSVDSTATTDDVDDAADEGISIQTLFSFCVACIVCFHTVTVC